MSRRPSSPLQRVTELPGHEGLSDAEAAAGSAAATAELVPASASTPRGACTTELVAELVAEAADEQEGGQGRQLQRAWELAQWGSSSTITGGGGGEGSGSREASPEVEAEAVAAAGSKLKLHLPVSCSTSPSSSPGIQAVHNAGNLAAAAAADAAADRAGQSPSPQRSPQRMRDAFSVEPAEQPPRSPFASQLVQAAPLRRTSSSGAYEAACAAGGSGIPQQEGERRPPEQQPPEQQAQQAQATSSEEEGSEDVYARFGSYDKMVAYFQQLSAQGLQDAGPQQADGGGGDEGQQDQQPPFAPEAAAAHARPVSRSGSLQADNPDFTVTAASSFSGGPACIALFARERWGPQPSPSLVPAHLPGACPSPPVLPTHLPAPPSPPACLQTC